MFHTLTIIVSLSIPILAILTYYNIRESPFIKQVKYETSLLATKYTQQEWWNDIPSHKIVLGGIPLKNENHFSALREKNIDSVLILLEIFELEDGWLNEPVKILEWEAIGKRVKHIKAVDFSPLKEEEFREALDFLEKELEQNRRVYVHCKAGRGRSASIVITYLMKKEGISYEEAFSRVSSVRPRVNMNQYQIEAISSYIENLDKESFPIKKNYMMSEKRQGRQSSWDAFSCSKKNDTCSEHKMAMTRSEKWKKFVEKQKLSFDCSLSDELYNTFCHTERFYFIHPIGFFLSVLDWEIFVAILQRYVLLYGKDNSFQSVAQNRDATTNRSVQLGYFVV